MKTQSLLPGFALPLLLLSLPSSAPAADAQPVVTGRVTWLGWMTGCWISRTPEAEIEERWSSPDAGTMIGTGRTFVRRRTVEHEFLFIREVPPATLEYVANPDGKGETVFRLASIAPGEVVFVNPQHDFPQKITYRKTKDGIAAKVEGTTSEGTRTVDFEMKRAICPGPSAVDANVDPKKSERGKSHKAADEETP
jgi:hypothetical protein